MEPVVKSPRKAPAKKADRLPLTPEQKLKADNTRLRAQVKELQAELASVPEQQTLSQQLLAMVEDPDTDVVSVALATRLIQRIANRPA